MRKQFDGDPAGDAAPDRDSRAVDGDQEGTSKRAVRRDGDGVSGVNPHLAKASLKPVAAVDGDDPCTLSGAKLFESHEANHTDNDSHYQVVRDGGCPDSPASRILLSQ